MRTDKIKIFMKILLLFMCSSVGNVFCSLWKLVFTTKLQTNNCQLQLTGYYIDDSCYNYSFHIQLCYIFSIFSQKFFSIFSMVPESKKFFPSLLYTKQTIALTECLWNHQAWNTKKHQILIESYPEKQVCSKKNHPTTIHLIFSEWVLFNLNDWKMSPLEQEIKCLNVS